MAEPSDPKGPDSSGAVVDPRKESDVRGAQAVHVEATLVDGSTRWSRGWDMLVKAFPSMLTIGTALVFVVILTSVFLPYLKGDTEQTLLRELGDVQMARGLITFLIAVSTVAIAVVVILYVVVGQTAAVKDSFPFAKDVLTVLIGVLGTILGFYFGSTQQEQPDGASSVVAAEQSASEQTLAEQSPNPAAQRLAEQNP